MMTCEQIREALETEIVNETVSRHLHSCAACRKESAATASLVSLLNAQPKVKAPADFMAQLQLRMATQAVNENAQLKSLLQIVPAVSAPADFAFRVRARLAQARANETVRNPFAWLNAWFTQSFSFGQAATAMAAVALIVAFTTMQIRNGGSTPNTTNSNIAQVMPQVMPLPSVGTAASVDTSQPVAIKNFRTARQNVMAKAPLVMPVKAEAMTARTMPGKMIEPAVYSVKARQEVHIALDGRPAYGQQLAKVMAAAQKAETMIAAF